MAGRAARWVAACCGCSCACLMVYGGRAARPTGSSAAQGASMRSALHVRLLRGWRVCFRAVRDARMCSRCGRGRARGAAWSHRGPTSVGLRRDEGGRAERPCRHRVAAKEKARHTDTNKLTRHTASWLPHTLSWRTVLCEVVPRKILFIGDGTSTRQFAPVSSLCAKKRKKENIQPKGGMGERHAATTQGFCAVRESWGV